MIKSGVIHTLYVWKPKFHFDIATWTSYIDRRILLRPHRDYYAGRRFCCILGCFTLIAIRHSYFVSARVGFRRTFGAIMHQPTLPTNEECVGTLNREVVHLLNVLFFSNSTHNTSAAPRLANMGTHPELPRPHPAALGCVEGVLGRRGDRLGVDGQVFEHGV